MSRTVDPSSLADAIARELAEYSQEVIDGLKQEVRDIARECRDEIAQNSPARTGGYRKGWKTKTAYESASDIRIVVHNKKHYRLTHLLENGHALVYPGKGGALVTRGRVAARPHILPAQQHAEEKLLRKVKVVVRG